MGPPNCCKWINIHAYPCENTQVFPTWGDLEGYIMFTTRGCPYLWLTCTDIQLNFHDQKHWWSLATLDFVGIPKSVGESNPPQADLYNALQCLERE